MVLISSKKMVPWSATSNRPFFEATAPVNAPLTWPNSWDSSRSTGIEPVLTGTKGLSARVEAERSEEHTSELQSLAYLVCRLLLEKKKHEGGAAEPLPHVPKT